MLFAPSGEQGKNKKKIKVTIQKNKQKDQNNISYDTIEDFKLEQH